MPKTPVKISRTQKNLRKLAKARRMVKVVLKDAAAAIRLTAKRKDAKSKELCRAAKALQEKAKRLLAEVDKLERKMA